MNLECIRNSNCSYTNCKITILHRHCNYCKEIENNNWYGTTKNCSLCAREITAKAKIAPIINIIKNEISNCKHEHDDTIINILKSKILIIKDNLKHFHNKDEDILQIIDNYFDKSKKLPLISVNGCFDKVDLNNSRKKKEFDNTNLNYLKLINNNKKVIYINCSYNDKDECKSLGGKWDVNKKSWYIPNGIDSTKFKKWL